MKTFVLLGEKSRTWLLTSLIVVLFSAGNLPAQTTVSPNYPYTVSFLWGNTSVNAKGSGSFVNGTGYGYRYITPKNFNANTKYPTIIYLHGSGEAGSNNTNQLDAGNNTAYGALALVSVANPDNQTNFPCFFIAPQCPLNDTWSSDNSATAIQNLINIFKTQYPNAFDTTRIYLTGNSLGGIGTYDLPYVMAKPTHLGSNPFAALVPMSGEIGYYDGRTADTEPNLPIWAFHGALDQSVKIDESDDVDVPIMRNRGISVIYSRYTSGPHIIWGLTYQHPQLLPWLFSQKLGQAAQPLSNFAITGASQPSSQYLNLSGTASTAEGYTGIAWSNATTTNSGTLTGAITPTWSIANIPLTSGANSLQMTASAPNNTGYVFGTFTNYGGNLTVNLPYSITSTTGSTNIALNKTVTASSTDTASNSGANAVDGNTSTRWSSAYSDPQWIVVDLGANYNIQQVNLNWETACGKDYQIQTSLDGTTWTTQTTVTGNTTSGVHSYIYPSNALPVGRYIRMNGTARATTWGYSLYELTVNGTVATTTPTTKLSLSKTVAVSSVDSSANAGNLAVDSDTTTTRWASAFSDPQWISIDLGASHKISQITLTWETACGKNYLLQTSTDNVNWTTQTTVTGNTSAGLLTYTYSTPPSGRYIRMYGTARATGWGYSLFDFSVYGQ